MLIQGVHGAGSQGSYSLISPSASPTAIQTFPSFEVAGQRGLDGGWKSWIFPWTVFLFSGTG